MTNLYQHPPIYNSLNPWQRNFLDLMSLEIMGIVGDCLMVMRQDGNYIKLPFDAASPDVWVEECKIYELMASAIDGALTHAKRYDPDAEWDVP